MEELCGARKDHSRAIICSEGRGCSHHFTQLQASSCKQATCDMVDCQHLILILLFIACTRNNKLPGRRPLQYYAPCRTLTKDAGRQCHKLPRLPVHCALQIGPVLPAADCRRQECQWPREGVVTECERLTDTSGWLPGGKNINHALTHTEPRLTLVSALLVRARPACTVLPAQWGPSPLSEAGRS